MKTNLHARRQRDQFCDRFEKKWLEDNHLRIEQFVRDCHGNDNGTNNGEINGELHGEPGPDTIDELIILEIDLKHAAGLIPDEHDYEQRFPERPQAIKSGFKRIEKLEQSSIVGSHIDRIQDEISGLHYSGASTIPETLGVYRIIRPLGSGAFGVVFKARDQETGEVFALKFPKKKSLRSVDELCQLQNEAESVRHLDHPAIIKSYGLQQYEGLMFIVQQYVNGKTLQQMELSDPREIVEVIARVAEGLAYAHKESLIHRDLKPSNIMIDNSGQPLIADFGLAIHESAQRRLKGQRCGSPPYMSPEQVMGLTHQLDGRSDIWSLGVTLYELLAGRRPFDGATSEEIFEEIKLRNEKPLCMVRPDLDHELQRICLKCLAKPIRERYHTAGELADDLNNWLMFEDQWQANAYVPLIPRGLRALGAQDADAYLQLLPGHRNRHGIPDSIEFWKQKLESFDGGERFTIGAILGPSGCGKSSFVKAGLIPRLESNIVRTVYVEASASNTEERLRKSLHAVLKGIPNDKSLAEIFDGIKNQVWSQDGRKLLIVIDQFEQWLFEHPKGDGTELVQALRHCDGENLHCIFLLRDDFWLGASRLFNLLDVGWSEDSNIQKLDLLNESHARDVLFRIGRALKRLPEDKEELTTAQKGFLRKVVHELAHDGMLVCVHLSLFAEMFKNRKWTDTELKKIGGISGVGETYLEETFGSRSTFPQSRHFRNHCKHVFGCLLPKSSSNLRTHMCDVAELRNAAGNLDESNFELLINWLDQDLQLITRTSPHRTDNELSEEPSTGEKVHYQLAHDYLVPALRSWLKRRKRETWRGRTELRLQELSDQWTRQQETRFLPSFSDLIRIRAGVRSSQMSQSELKFVTAAKKLHVSRFAMAASFSLVILTLIGWLLFSAWRKEAIAQTANFINSPPSAERLDELKRYSFFANRILESAEETQPLRCAVALNAIQRPTESRTDRIAANLGAASEREFLFVIGELESYNDLAIRSLQKRYAATDDTEERVRLATGLLYLGNTEKAIGYYSDHNDPTDATLLTHAIVDLFPDNARLVDLAIQYRRRPDLLFGLMIAASNYEFREWSSSSQAKWKELLGSEFRSNADSGIHEACRYLARKWPEANIRLSAPCTKVPTDKDWWNVEVLPGHELTFIRIRKQCFARTDTGQSELKTQYFWDTKVEIEEEYWICSTEITFGLIAAWLDAENPGVDGQSHEPDQWRDLRNRLSKSGPSQSYFDRHEMPACGLTHNEFEQFTEWLNVQIHQLNSIPELKLSLPNSDQWECATRAGSTTWFSFGSESLAELVNRYAVLDDPYRPSVNGRKLLEPGSRIPNRWGLFDTAGNVAEFIRKSDSEYVIDNEEGCFVRAVEKCSPGEVEEYQTSVYFRYFGLRPVLESDLSKVALGRQKKIRQQFSVDGPLAYPH